MVLSKSRKAPTFHITEAMLHSILQGKGNSRPVRKCDQKWRQE